MRFLLENPVFLIVIIGYIISFFTKKKKVQHENQKGKQSDVKQNPARGIYKQLQEKMHQLESRTLEDQQRKEAERIYKLEQEVIERQKAAEESLNSLNEQQHLAAKRVEQIKTVYEKSSATTTAVPIQERKLSMSPSKKQLVDGIIWSEIIGPPRALNPHRSIKKP